MCKKVCKSNSKMHLYGDLKQVCVSSVQVENPLVVGVVEIVITPTQ